MNFDIIERAGLTQQEFADLIQFSRPSVNLWINGRKTPGKRAARTLQAAQQVLAKAVEENHLPAKSKAAKVKLLAAIKKWVAASAAGL